MPAAKDASPPTREQRLTRRRIAGSAAAAAGVLFGLDAARAIGAAGYTPFERFSADGPATNGAVACEAEGSQGIGSHCNSSDWSPEPQMRLRVSRASPDARGGQHMFVVPYQYGMAIEYNGVVECWVDEWSIHNNEQGGNGGDGARLWVGNHGDTGGLLLRGHDTAAERYGVISSELFTRASGGDLRLLVRDAADAVEIRTGPSYDEQPLVRFGRQMPVRIAGPAGSATVLRIQPAGTLQLSPAGQEPAILVDVDDGDPHFMLTRSGQVYARLNRPEQVWIGAAGPHSQAGVTFGQSGDVRLYREAPRVLRTGARVVADGGLGVGNAEPTQPPPGAPTGRIPMYDSAGRLLGYTPLHAPAV